MGRLREGTRTRGNHTVSTTVALAKCVPSGAVSLALEAALEAWQGRPLDSPSRREQRASVTQLRLLCDIEATLKRTEADNKIPHVRKGWNRSKREGYCPLTS